MNVPPLYRLAQRSAALLAVLGSPEPRIYPWDENGDKVVIFPYVTWAEVGGSPHNQLAGRPCGDRVSTQIDVWAKTKDSANAVAQVLRDAIELDCYITAWRGRSRDPETKVYRISFDADWQLSR